VDCDVAVVKIVSYGVDQRWQDLRVHHAPLSDPTPCYECLNQLRYRCL
jgi:hypothetical protein